MLVLSQARVSCLFSILVQFCCLDFVLLYLLSFIVFYIACFVYCLDNFWSHFFICHYYHHRQIFFTFCWLLVLRFCSFLTLVIFSVVFRLFRLFFWWFSYSTSLSVIIITILIFLCLPINIDIEASLFFIFYHFFCPVSLLLFVVLIIIFL